MAWTTGYRNSRTRSQVFDGGELIATVEDTTRRGRDNACLIATAPDLLQALRDMVAEYEGYSNPQTETYRRAVALLEKLAFEASL